MLYAVVLGSAAGGGFPQWNSNAPACRRAREGSAGAIARSQASIAVSGNGRDWFVFNARPTCVCRSRRRAPFTPERGCVRRRYLEWWLAVVTWMPLLAYCTCASGITFLFMLLQGSLR
jgi:coenzyme PQQ biosynthesis protein B